MAFIIILLTLLIVVGTVLLCVNKDKETVEIPKIKSLGLFKSTKKFFSEIKKEINENLSKEATTKNTYSENIKYVNIDDSTSSDKYKVVPSMSNNLFAGDDDNFDSSQVETINIVKDCKDQVFKMGRHLFVVNFTTFIMDNAFVDLKKPFHEESNDNKETIDIWIEDYNIFIVDNYNDIVSSKKVVYHI